ncbi:RhuM family protein [Marinomonas balearica]|uniref:RhuM family protein n=1 Tax=Marinomonas balearica TaxID=491947 RepID=UPI00105B5C66|nr:RhuM family protein [Marinomonas balearica]
MWLYFVEDQAQRKKQVFLKDWEIKLDQFLEFNDREVLVGAGCISKKQAKAKAKAKAKAEAEYDRFAEERRRIKGDRILKNFSIGKLPHKSQEL